MINNVYITGLPIIHKSSAAIWDRKFELTQRMRLGNQRGEEIFPFLNEILNFDFSTLLCKVETDDFWLDQWKITGYDATRVSVGEERKEALQQIFDMQLDYINSKLLKFYAYVNHVT